MTVQLSLQTRHNILEAIELSYNGQTLNAGTGITGTAQAPKVIVYNGTAPANTAAALSGNTALATVTLPSDWLNDASGGSKTLKGTWTTTASAAGTATFYRIYDNAGTTCHEQGTCSATGGGGDMTIDNPTLAVGQTFNITSKTITAPNA